MKRTERRLTARDRLNALLAKWEDQRAHTYASENADHYRGFDAGQQRCAEELRAVLKAIDSEPSPFAEQP
jgi:hypothetical protein